MASFSLTEEEEDGERVANFVIILFQLVASSSSSPALLWEAWKCNRVEGGGAATVVYASGCNCGIFSEQCASCLLCR